MTLIETLMAQRKGAMVIEADEKLRKLVKTCMETGKGGSFTLKLKLTPTAEAVVLRDDVSTAPPKPENLGTTFFADDDGTLSRNNPKQLELVPDEKVVAAN